MNNNFTFNGNSVVKSYLFTHTSRWFIFWCKIFTPCESPQSMRPPRYHKPCQAHASNQLRQSEHSVPPQALRLDSLLEHLHLLRQKLLPRHHFLSLLTFVSFR